MKTPHKMLHYGWACAAPWQMLRHTSGSQPAGGECRDVAATQHRSCQATICRLQNGLVCCNMTSIPVFPPPNTYIWKVDAFLFHCFCANRSRSTFSQHCSFQCTKMWTEGRDGQLLVGGTHTDANGICSKNRWIKTCMYNGGLFRRQHLWNGTSGA